MLIKQFVLRHTLICVRNTYVANTFPFWRHDKGTLVALYEN
uniref:Uncharacterized protein n=1 Tax=Rhizophora mucronata TaxID=61149 RepID=A0A2P2NP65_RHIMU